MESARPPLKLSIVSEAMHLTKLLFLVLIALPLPAFAQIAPRIDPLEISAVLPFTGDKKFVIGCDVRRSNRAFAM